MCGRMIMFFVLFFYIQVPASAFMEEFSGVIPELQPAAQDNTRPASGSESRVSGAGSSSGKAEDVMKPPDIREIVSIPKIIWSIIFIVAGYFILNILERVTNLVSERQAKYRLLIKSIIPIIKIFGWIFIIFVIIAGIFQPPMATVLAFAASIGVAVGFASQDFTTAPFNSLNYPG